MNFALEIFPFTPLSKQLFFLSSKKDQIFIHSFYEVTPYGVITDLLLIHLR